MSDEPQDNLDDEPNPFQSPTSGGLGSEGIGELPGSRERTAAIAVGLDQISDKNIDYQDKMHSLVGLIKEIIPTLVTEVNSIAPNVDRSVVSARLIIAFNNIAKILEAQRAAELTEEINVRSPKFQLIFGWFLELTHDIMVSQGVEGTQINNVFNSLALELGGWEDKIEKSLKGIKGKAIEQVRSPWIEEFKDKVPAPKKSNGTKAKPLN
ncbi:MAG TPA: hypothetical protein ENI23_12205 [bacterium]|nr:hypothetical protein [bacterium]